MPNFFCGHALFQAFVVRLEAPSGKIIVGYDDGYFVQASDEYRSTSRSLMASPLWSSRSKCWLHLRPWRSLASIACPPLHAVQIEFGVISCGITFNPIRERASISQSSSACSGLHHVCWPPYWIRYIPKVYSVMYLSDTKWYFELVPVIHQRSYGSE